MGCGTSSSRDRVQDDVDPVVTAGTTANIPSIMISTGNDRMTMNISSTNNHHSSLNADVDANTLRMLEMLLAASRPPTGEEDGSTIRLQMNELFGPRVTAPNFFSMAVSGPSSSATAANRRDGNHLEDILFNLLMNNLVMSNHNVMMQTIGDRGERNLGLTREAFDALRRETVGSNTDIASMGDCGITLEAFTVGDVVVVLPCKHHFKEDAIRNWLERNNTCPICRVSVDN